MTGKVRLILSLTILGLFWSSVSCDKDSEEWREVCKLPSDRGDYCGNYTIRWFYNDAEEQCDRFWYGLCGGNKNNFETEDDCNANCKDTKGTGTCSFCLI